MLNNDRESMHRDFLAGGPSPAEIAENHRRVEAPNNSAPKNPIVTSDVEKAAERLARLSFEVVQAAFERSLAHQ